MFDEQASDPQLLARRGQRPGQPLPPDLGLLDADGRLCSPLRRDALQTLEHWVGDYDAILAWSFPNGLKPGVKQDLLIQIESLARHRCLHCGQGWPKR